MTDPVSPHADESIDVFDELLRPAGSVDRAIAHRDGLWHQVFHCLVVRTASPARVLLQRRHAAARSFAGLLDLTATGHLMAGEQPDDGVRELYEEVGVTAAPAALVPLGRRLMVDEGGEGEGRNREIIHAFLLPLDTPLDAFDLVDRDVDGLVEIEVADLLRIVDDPLASASAREVDHTGVVRDIVCSAGDLVPAIDGYWIVMAIMAQRFVAGQGPLGI